MSLSDVLLQNIEDSDKEALEISYCDLSNKKDIKDLITALNKNYRIKSVRLYQCAINDEGAEELSNASYLIQLDLSQNNIGPKGIEYLARKRLLKKLNLSGNEIGIEGVQTLSSSQTLQELILGGCKLGNSEAHIILSTKSKSLTKLDLNTNDISDEAFQDISTNLILQELNLFQNNIGDKGAELIVSIFPELHSLNLGTNLIGDKGARVLALHKKLIDLDLRQNKIQEEGFKAFCESTIKQLCLYGNEITFSKKEPLPTNNAITALNLSFNKIEDNPEEPIKSLVSFSSLKELMMDENNISSKVAEQLYNEILKKPDIEVVDLRSNENPLLFSYKRKRTESSDEEFSSEKALKFLL